MTGTIISLVIALIVFAVIYKSAQRQGTVSVNPAHVVATGQEIDAIEFFWRPG